MNEEGLVAIREFYENSAQALFTYALALTRCPQAAEDAVHDGICSLLRRASLPSELRPYAFRCVRNAAIDGHRRLRPSEPAGIFEGGPKADGTFEHVLYREIEAALTELPPDEMETIVLHALNGLTLREIADVKNASINAVGSWYRRGLEKVRERVS